MDARRNRKPAAVFVDLENVTGFGSRLSEHARDNIVQLLKGVKEVLDQNDIEIAKLYAYARNRGQLEETLQAVPLLFGILGYVMRWTKGVADDDLIDEARQKMASGVLPPLIVIVSDDGDFIPLIKDLKGHNHRVAVFGRFRKARLAKEADYFFSLTPVLQRS